MLFPYAIVGALLLWYVNLPGQTTDVPVELRQLQLSHHLQLQELRQGLQATLANLQKYSEDDPAQKQAMVDGLRHLITVAHHRPLTDHQIEVNQLQQQVAYLNNRVNLLQNQIQAIGLTPLPAAPAGPSFPGTPSPLLPPLPEMPIPPHFVQNLRTQISTLDLQLQLQNEAIITRLCELVEWMNTFFRGTDWDLHILNREFLAAMDDIQSRHLLNSDLAAIAEVALKEFLRSPQGQLAVPQCPPPPPSSAPGDAPSTSTTAVPGPAASNPRPLPDVNVLARVMLSLIRLLIASTVEIGIQDFYPDHIPMTEDDFLSLQHLHSSMDWQVILNIFSRGQFRSSASQPGPPPTSQPDPASTSQPGPSSVTPGSPPPQTQSPSLQGNIWCIYSLRL